jgi:hypothetical protein
MDKKNKFIAGKKYCLYVELFFNSQEITRCYENAEFIKETSNGWFLFSQPAIDSFGEDTEYDLYLEPHNIKSFKKAGLSTENFNKNPIEIFADLEDIERNPAYGYAIEPTSRPRILYD